MRHSHNPPVVGSSPTRPTRVAGFASGVAGVAGLALRRPWLIARSIGKCLVGRVSGVSVCWPPGNLSGLRQPG
jgi:hypothetical protein